MSSLSQLEYINVGGNSRDLSEFRPKHKKLRFTQNCGEEPSEILPNLFLGDVHSGTKFSSYNQSTEISLLTVNSPSQTSIKEEEYHSHNIRTG